MKNIILAIGIFISINAIAAPSTFSELNSSSSFGNIIDLGLYFDSYYQYNFNMPPQPALPTASTSNPAGTTSLHAYDRYHNQVTLNLLELTLKKSKREVAFVADLDFGDFVEMNKAAVLSTTNYPFDRADVVFEHIGQANLTYMPETFKLMTFKVGKFYSLMGLENPKPKDNWNYSRSYSYYYGKPLWHLGADFTFILMPDFVKADFYYVHGWDNYYRHEKAPTYGVKLSLLNLNDVADFSMGFINGKAEPIRTAPPLIIANNMKNKTVFNANLIYKVSSNFAFTGETYYGIGFRNDENTSRWWSLIAGFKFALPYRNAWFSPRVEYYEDKDDMTTGMRQSIKAVTLTHNMTLAENLSLVGELRYDHSNHNAYRKRDTEPFIPSYKDKMLTMTASLQYNL